MSILIMSCPCCGAKVEIGKNLSVTPTTNGDRIRSMTDEELAEFLSDINGDFLPTGEKLIVSQSEKRWLDWLKQDGE